MTCTNCNRPAVTNGVSPLCSVCKLYIYPPDPFAAPVLQAARDRLAEADGHLREAGEHLRVVEARRVKWREVGR